MKKLVALLVIVAVAVPAMAATTVTCAQVGTTAAFTVSYAYTTGTSFPRAFALDITTSKGSFSSVTPTIVGESVATAKGFGIFPGTILIDSTGTVTSPGVPVAPQSDLPLGTQPGLNTSGMTIELGSLYANSATSKPNASGVLVTVAMTGLTAGNTATITIAPNTARGGLVLEDASTAAVSSTCTVGIAAPGCACKGDFAGGTGGIADGKVTSADVVALVGKLNTYGGTKAAKSIPSSSTNFVLCGDVGGGTGGIPDNLNTSADVVKLVGWLNSYGGTKAAKSITCPHTYN